MCRKVESFFLMSLAIIWILSAGPGVSGQSKCLTSGETSQLVQKINSSPVAENKELRQGRPEGEEFRSRRSEVKVEKLREGRSEGEGSRLGKRLGQGLGKDQ